jgi:hypothetical protein
MNLPNVITGLVKAQDVHDSAAYANCFAETACVFDEGKLRNGEMRSSNGLKRQTKNTRLS